MPGVCPRCLREVYFAEEKLALGKVWHTFCFSCRNCRKLLDSWTVETHSGELFCRNCYSRLYSTTSVRPSLPVPISPIFSSVDKKNLAVSSCESLSDHCCCICCDEKYTSTDPASTNSQLVVEALNCPTENQRLQGGDSYDDKDDREDDPSEIVGGDIIDACDPDNGNPELDLQGSPITIHDQPGDPTDVTTWYNKHHSASQSIFSHSSSAHQNPPRPSSTPTSESAVNICNNCNSICSKKRPGSPCRTNHRRCQCVKQCHRQICHEFQRPDKTQFSQEDKSLTKECRGKNFADNHHKHSRKSSYPPLPPHHTPPPFRRRVTFPSLKSSPSGEAIACSTAMENIVDDDSNKVDILSIDHPANYDDADQGNNEPTVNFGISYENKEDTDDVVDREEYVRIRGGCGGGGGGSGCCCSGGSGGANCGVDNSRQSPCGRRYQYDRSSTIEGACGCGSRAKAGCGSGGNSGAHRGRCEAAPRAGGCCGTSGDESNEGTCASMSPMSSRLTGYETCPPRSPDRCTADPSSLPSCSATACSPPCSGRKGCCPPAGCRPVRRRFVRCNAPCTGDSQSCGGGGCCGSGCRGGCGKPGQTCLPLRPCTIPPCQPHSRAGGSPCMPPRACPPQPPCCRIPNVLGTSNISGTGGSGGSSCCRPRSSGGRSGGGGGGRCCSPSNGCQQDDAFCGAGKLPAGCECLGGGQDCQRCGRKVYQAEMQIASGVPYHNICFSCFCCRKPLETLTYHENCGEIYCKQCYVRNFGPQGYGYSGVLQTPM